MSRREYKLSPAQLMDLQRASQPVPYLVASGTEPRSPQENANDEWERIGVQLGFDPYTVQPVVGKDQEYFTAEEIVRQ